MDIFPLVYRCAVVIKSKQPMLDWLKAIDCASVSSWKRWRRRHGHSTRKLTRQIKRTTESAISYIYLAMMCLMVKNIN